MFFLLALFYAALALAQGGPPMVTDDPGTPGDGHWEINIASLWSVRANQDLAQFPYFDINYGWGERVQLKIEGGWNITSASNGLRAPFGTGTEFGTAIAGVKFRFYDHGGLTLSTYPQIQFHDYSSAGDQYIFPIEAAKVFGNWVLNPEAGYIGATTVPDELFYGVVLAFENAKPWEPLFEVHANTNLDGTGTATLLNLGFRYALNEKINLIGALGHSVTHVADAATELDAYAGIQLEL